MSNLIFPALPGVSIEVSKTPLWKSTVHESVSGCQVSASAMTYPRWRYKLRYEFLRSGAQAELQQLVGFFNRHRGRADTWLYFDDEDCIATAQQFGVGDGVTTDFYLVRDFGGFIEPVTDIKRIDSLTVGGVQAYRMAEDFPGNTLSLDFTRISTLETGPSMDLDFTDASYVIWEADESLLPDALSIFEIDYTYAGGGRVQFVTAPAAGAPLIWTGEFYRRCRFRDDELDIERFLYLLWKAKTVEFETHKGV